MKDENMFRDTCLKVREAIYGVLCVSNLQDTQTADSGSGFMIAPGVIATVAHALHINGDIAEPLHQTFEVIRTPDIGKDMQFAHVLAEDIDRDLALLPVEYPHDYRYLRLVENTAQIGSKCGFQGFPLSSVEFNENGINLTLIERFQGAYISAYMTETDKDRDLNWYETDQLMYSGSSGCPGFLQDGRVFGMQSNTLTTGETDDESKRLAIARQVPSMEILAFARANGITL